MPTLDHRNSTGEDQVGQGPSREKLLGICSRVEGSPSMERNGLAEKLVSYKSSTSKERGISIESGKGLDLYFTAKSEIIWKGGA